MASKQPELTPVEHRICVALANGYVTDEEIAERAGVALLHLPRTMARLRRKLGVHSRVELLAAAQRQAQSSGDQPVAPALVEELATFHQHTFEAYLILCNLLSASGMVVDRSLGLDRVQRRKFAAQWRLSLQQVLGHLHQAIEALLDDQ